jgi:hypothetical protein
MSDMAPAEQITPIALQELLTDPALARKWDLDPSRSTVSLRNRSMWGLAPVNGVFRQREHPAVRSGRHSLRHPQGP